MNDPFRLGLAGLLAGIVAVTGPPQVARAPTSSLSTARPTKIQSLSKSIEQLLNDGYAIVAMNAGIAGFGFVLHKDKSWVFCQLAAGDPGAGTAVSDCGALN